MPTTAASKILDGYYPPYDATVVERLEAAGAVIVGKTNCDEFAMGSSTENSAFGIDAQSVEPRADSRRLERRLGRGGGGRTRAAGARIRHRRIDPPAGRAVRRRRDSSRPTAACSRYGLIAFASSLDQIGPIASTVEDAALR